MTAITETSGEKKERSRDNAERKMGLSCHWWHFSDFTPTDVWIRSSEDGVMVTRLVKHPELINHSASHRYSANTQVGHAWVTLWAMSPESMLRPGLHMCCKALIRCANLTLKECWRAAWLPKKVIIIPPKACKCLCMFVRNGHGFWMKLENKKENCLLSCTLAVWSHLAMELERH